MSKKEKITEADKALFHEAMKGVKPISRSSKITLAPTLPPPRKRSRKILDEQALSPLSDYETLDLLDSEDLVEYKRPGLQDKILRNLRTGKYNVDAILDLHGMIVDEAREALYQFLLKCAQKGVCSLLIIHGKGRGTHKPILKNKLNHWLRQLDTVLAFCSATGKEGRSGAMVVLIKNQKGEKLK